MTASVKTGAQADNCLILRLCFMPHVAREVNGLVQFRPREYGPFCAELAHTPHNGR